jgi:hypothetical protein
VYVLRVIVRLVAGVETEDHADACFGTKYDGGRIRAAPQPSPPVP